MTLEEVENHCRKELEVGSMESNLIDTFLIMDFPGGSDGKASAYNAGDPGSIPGSGRSPEKEMATHSSVLAWKIHGWRSLACYSTWGCKDSDMTKQLCFLPLEWY